MAKMTINEALQKAVTDSRRKDLLTFGGNNYFPQKLISGQAHIRHC